MASPTIDREKAIRVLLDAAVSGDRAACERAKIDERTLRRWRVKLGSDPELTAAFRAKNEVEDRSWKAARRQALAAGVRKLEALIEVADSEQLRDVAMAVKVLGELEITQEALGSSSTNQPGESAGEAEGDPRAAGAPSGSRQARAVH